MALAALQATASAAAAAAATAAPAAAAETAAAMAAAAAAAAAEAGSRSARAAAAGAGAEAGAESGWARVAQLVRGCRPHAAALGEEAGALDRLQRCLVDAALACLGDVLREERVVLAPGVELVRLRNSDGARAAGAGEGEGEGVWDQALALLRSYSLHVGPPEALAHEGRLRRRQYKHMFPLMVMSFMALSAFMVPMGFQFMAVLGGKALLLSKMALLVASLLTYKKLATDFAPHHSHGHGHAHSAYHDPFYYGWHDRAASSNKWQ
ncbi:hypothetical protein R5R35_002096 [Gryllus longicercus]